ncbi:hypothetical protein MiSe_90700 [Microseira wollei NIES-4236]|uniref:Flagellin n=2 Tax=Microseira wollei TaxID=467598 RepID=A0AAV3WQ05_9CYAN|nr:hypothetical protein MiSe_90700 [Microseira wollei NIES-4236]
MIINDLNYLEDATQEIVGGRGTNMNSNYTVTKTVTASVSETITKTLDTNLAGLEGNVAQVIATADAREGNITFTSIIAGAQTEADSSESFVQIVAATK